MPQVNLLLVTIWLEAWGQVGCASEHVKFYAD